MKNLKKLIPIITIVPFMLVGCGSSDQSDKSTSDKPKEEQTSKNSEKKTESTNNTNNASSENNQGTVRILEKKLAYQINNEQKEETAFLKQIDNSDQNYSMFVLPEYELTSEEPNKDLLFLTNDNSIAMRIELLPTDSDWNMLQDNVKAQVSANSPDVKSPQIPSGEFFKDAVAFESEKDGQIVASYLTKQTDTIVKLTIFTKKDNDHRDAFLKMAETIIKENK